MSYAEVLRGTKRSTICSPEWPADVRILAPDRIALNGAGQCLVEVQWPAGQTGPLILRLEAKSEAGGALRFDTQNGPTEKTLQGTTTTLLTLFGLRASLGEADVTLIVQSGDDARKPLKLGVGPSPGTLAIQGQSGAAPSFVPVEQPIALTAVVTPAAAPGSVYRWLVIGDRAGLTINQANPNAATVTVIAHAIANRASFERRLGVLYTPPAGSNQLALIALYSFAADDLEQAFTAQRLYTVHLQSDTFRQRLEALTPAAAQRFLDQASDPALRDYLTRLLAFVTEQAPLRAAPAGNRERITIILGRDDDPFYRAAHAHFTRNPAGTLVLPDAIVGPGVTPALSEVLDYLRNHPPGNGLPWGEINLIVHANEDGGMQMPVTPLAPGDNPAFHNVSVFTLPSALASGALRPLPDNQVDVRTEVRVRGCSIGRSQDALRLLSHAFGGNEAQRPGVRAPKHLQAYEFAPANWQPPAQPTRSDEFYVEFWFEEFPTGQRPTDATLIQRFTANNPNAGVNWADALSRPGHPVRDLPSHETRERTYDFDLNTLDYLREPADNAALATLLSQIGGDFTGAQQVQITARQPQANGFVRIVFDFERNGAPITGASVDTHPPVPTNDAQSLDFLRNHPQAQVVRTDLAGIQQSVGDYAWTFQRQDQAIGGGQRSFRLQAHGSRTILRVERELREPDPNNPGQTRRLYPALTDLTHFGEEIPVRPPAQPLGQNVSP